IARTAASGIARTYASLFMFLSSSRKAGPSAPTLSAPRTPEVRLESLGIGADSGSSLVLIGADDFAAGSGPQGAVGADVDTVLDEPHRAVGHGEVGPAGVETAESPLTQVLAGRDRDPVGREGDRGEAGEQDRAVRVGRGIELRHAGRAAGGP